MGAGIAAALLTRLLELLQHVAWTGPGQTLLENVSHARPLRHVALLLIAGVVTGLAQLALTRLTSANSVEITTAMWFDAGRLPVLRTLGSSVLSIVVVALGASLGREGAPKQVGAVLANVLADARRLSDEQRRLLVACGAGAGMAAAYGVPLGGALFALEVLRGVLALRLVLRALTCSLIACVVAWTALPDAPKYVFPAYASSATVDIWALGFGPVAGAVSALCVRAIVWAERSKPEGWTRLVLPTLVLGVLGLVSIPFPQLLGNGRDVAELAFLGAVPPMLLVALVLLRPAATVLCTGSGTPGGLFTPSIALGALLGGALGHAWCLLWPGAAPGLFAVIGAAAVLAATTQGPISSIVLLFELTGHDHSFIVPLLLAVITATLTSRTIETRSIYDARLTDEQVEARLRMRAAATH